jgi:hypothetical protein
MVLLPTESSKLLAQWQGPYVVNKRIGQVNYGVIATESFVFHVNMLRKWNLPTGTIFWAGEMSEEVVFTWKEQEDKTEMVMGKSLTTAQQNELRKLLRSFDNVLPR